MQLNPFEDLENEYNLSEILEYNGYCYETKEEYKEMFGLLDYKTLVKTINTAIEWHIYMTGGYQGDYCYVGQHNNKFYLVDIGYGSCSCCDDLLASRYKLTNLVDLQNLIKSKIREYDSLEELLNWIVNSAEWWFSYKDELLEYIKKEFNIDFEIIKTIKIK